MKIRPLQDRLIVFRIKGKTESPGGVAIPETAQAKPLEGIVYSVGDGLMLETGKMTAMDVKVKDHICFEKAAGTAIKIDGEDALMLRLDEVSYVIEAD